MFREEILLHPSSCPIQGTDNTQEICRNGQVTRELDLPEVERLPGPSQAVGGLCSGWKKEQKEHQEVFLPSLQAPSGPASKAPPLFSSCQGSGWRTQKFTSLTLV